MNLVDAGLDILYYLMTLDGVIESSEIQEIVKYLLQAETDVRKKTEKRIFSYQPDFTSLSLEIGLLSSLKEEELKKRYERAVSYYNEKSSKDQKNGLIGFAVNLVKADGTVLEEEKEALKRLSDIFKVGKKFLKGLDRQ